MHVCVCVYVRRKMKCVHGILHYASCYKIHHFTKKVIFIHFKVVDNTSRMSTHLVPKKDTLQESLLPNTSQQALERVLFGSGST